MCRDGLDQSPLCGADSARSTGTSCGPRAPLATPPPPSRHLSWQAARPSPRDGAIPAAQAVSQLPGDPQDPARWQSVIRPHPPFIVEKEALQSFSVKCLFRAGLRANQSACNQGPSRFLNRMEEGSQGLAELSRAQQSSAGPDQSSISGGKETTETPFLACKKIVKPTRALPRIVVDGALSPSAMVFHYSGVVNEAIYLGHSSRTPCSKYALDSCL